MYQNFYNLNENPFNLTPDPKFHYINQSTREALAALLYGIESRKGIITLVGDAGTGKTTLLKRVFETIQGETRMVFVFNPGVSFDELLEFICLDLGIHTDNSRRLHLLDRLNRYLLEQLTGGHNVVVMIDEAQTLNDETLEQLRLLTNLETAKEKTLQIVLSGQTELEEKLRKPSMRQLRQRIGARSMLRPMEKNEIGDYIETRLTSAGAEDPQMFSAAALKRIWRASGGIARVVNVICDSALVIGFAKSERSLSDETVKEAIRDLTGEGRVPGVLEKSIAWLSRPVQRYLAVTTAVLAIAVPLAVLLQRSSSPEPTVSAIRRSHRHASLQSRPQFGAPVRPVVQPADRQHAVAEQRSVTIVGQSLPGKAAEPPVGPSAEILAPRAVAPAAEAVPEPASRAAVPDRMVEDTIRRAELLARSAAARLYQGSEHRLSLESDATHPSGELKENQEHGRSSAIAARAAGAAAALRTPEIGPAVSASAVEIERPNAAPAVKSGHKTLAVAEPRPVVQSVAKKTPEPVPVGRIKAKAQSKPKPKPKPMPKAVVAVANVVTAAKAAKPAGHPVDGAILGWAAGRPPVGRLVRLRGGDTVWKVATRYYPDAGSATVDALVVRSPALKTMGPAEGGELMLLPFLTAQEMIDSGSDGSYKVLLARAPSRRQTEATAEWARVAVPRFSLRWQSPRSGGQPYSLYAVGFRSRNDALAAADYVLFKIAELQAGRSGRRASTSSSSRIVGSLDSGGR